MRIIFIRHGEPNYEKDILTSLGHKQAQKCAKRLKKHFNISEIYASSYGRAIETAKHYADLVNKPIAIIDNFHEVDWKIGMTYDWNQDNPWRYSHKILKNRKTSELPSLDIEILDEKELQRNLDRMVEGLEKILSENGYTRKDGVYESETPCDKTIAIFAHGGMISLALAYLTNVSPILFFGYQHMSFTGISVVDLKNRPNTKIVLPVVNRVNDHAHLNEID